MIRVLDVNKVEYTYTLNQLEGSVDYIDLEVWNISYEGASAIKLKYTAGFNHHGKRNYTINKSLVKYECLHYLLPEYWYHIIQYNRIKDEKKKFLINLYKQAMKVANKTIDEQEILRMLSDIFQYLKGEITKYKIF